jgi:hypothetical protein
MHPNSQNSPATEVWRRFAGMFGADAVARKYGNEIPPEWHAMLAKLNEHQVARGVRMLAYSGKPHVPSLPEFVKLCRDAEHDREGSDRLSLPPRNNYPGDGWDVEANNHFFAYVLRRLRDRKPIQPQELPAFLKMKAAWARDCREFVDEATGEVGRPPIAEQQSWWADVMSTAEEINAREAKA